MFQNIFQNYFATAIYQSILFLLTPEAVAWRVLWKFCFTGKSLCQSSMVVKLQQGRREGCSGAPSPPQFPGAKKLFFHLKFLHVTNMWDFISWTRHKWQKGAFSEFVVLAVNWATTVTNNKFVSFSF